MVVGSRAEVGVVLHNAGSRIVHICDGEASPISLCATPATGNETSAGILAGVVVLVLDTIRLATVSKASPASRWSSVDGQLVQLLLLRLLSVVLYGSAAAWCHASTSASERSTIRVLKRWRCTGRNKL